MIKSNNTFLDFKNNLNLLQYILFFFIIIFVLEHMASMAEVKLNVVLDAADYIGNSKINFLSFEYWFSMRPIGYPTFIKIFQSNPNLVASAQSLFYMVSWSFFAIYLYSKANNKVYGLVSGLIILFIGIQPDVSLWTHHILTESLTFTILLCIIILLYEFITSSKKIYFYILLSILIFYSTIRDVNAFYSISFIITFILLYLYRFINKIQLLIASLLLIMSLFFSVYSSNNSGKYELNKRWIFPFFNLTGHRILTNEDLLSFMQKEGMPVNEALKRKTKVWASRKDITGKGWYNDNELDKFREWVVNSGKSKYTKFLITHPTYTFGEIYSNRHSIFHYNGIVSKGYYLKGYKINNMFTYTGIENSTIYISSIFLVGMIILISLLLKLNIYNKNTMPFLTLLLPIILLSVITYHGDAMEVHRHTLIIPILIKLILLTIIFIFGNELFIQRKNKNDN